jgi:predicted phosphodiesterase
VRALVVSDLHFDLHKLDAVLDRVRDDTAGFDVLIVAGDLLNVAGRLPLDAQIPITLTYLERLAEVLPVVVCSGNHDLDHRAPSGEKATRWLFDARPHGVHVDGDSLDLEGWRLTACAWWEGPSTLADLEARLDQAAAAPRPERWLWAWHGPPEGPLSWAGDKSYPDPELPRLLAQHRPDLVLCGHIHQAPFTDRGAWAEHRDGTWLFNAGHEPGPRPTSIVLDLADDRARWTSSAGTGEVDLADPSSAADARVVDASAGAGCAH